MARITLLKDESVVLAALAAKISQTPFEEGDIFHLYKNCQADPDGCKELVNRIMKNNQHLIFGDVLPYAVALEDISRFAAIYFWRNVNVNNLVFGAGIEASLRVIKPNRYNEVVDELGKLALVAYQKAVELGVPEQDARYMLPEGTLTRMIFFAPPRYLVKLADSLQKTPLSELKEIGETIEKIVKEEFGLEVPLEILPSEWKFWGEEDIKTAISLDGDGRNPCSLSLNMGIRGSLSMYAQLVRQRQILCDIESLEGIVNKARFIIPPTFPENIKNDYGEIISQVRQKQLELIRKRDPNFVYFLLLGQAAESMIYGKGAAVIETSKARSEGTAQWEIRNQVGIPLTRELAKYPELQKEIGPRCWREGKCIEPSMFKTKKNICRAFVVSKGRWAGELGRLLEALGESYEIKKYP